MQPVGARRSPDQKTLIAPAVVYNYGFIKDWELVLQSQLETTLSPSGTTNLTESGAFLKHVLRPGSLQDRTGPSIATEFGVGYNSTLTLVVSGPDVQATAEKVGSAVKSVKYVNPTSVFVSPKPRRTVQASRRRCVLNTKVSNEWSSTTSFLRAGGAQSLKNPRWRRQKKTSAQAWEDQLF